MLRNTFNVNGEQRQFKSVCQWATRHCLGLPPGKCRLKSRRDDPLPNCIRNFYRLEQPVHEDAREDNVDKAPENSEPVSA